MMANILAFTWPFVKRDHRVVCEQNLIASGVQAARVQSTSRKVLLVGRRFTKGYFVYEGPPEAFATWRGLRHADVEW